MKISSIRPLKRGMFKVVLSFDHGVTLQKIVGSERLIQFKEKAAADADQERAYNEAQRKAGR